MFNEAKFGSGDVVALASRAVRDLLPSGQAIIARVAEELSLSPRTLQRRLRARGSSFSQLLAAARAALAREGLNSGLTTTQLAPVLGFSESSAVSRFLRESGIARDAVRTPGSRDAGIESVTDAIYDSEAPDRWSRAAWTIGSFLEGVHVRIWVTQPKTNEVLFDVLTPGLPTFLPRVYDEHFFKTDPAIPAILARPGCPISCVETADPVDFDKSELVNDLLDRPGIDVRWRMMEAAPLHGGQLLFFAAGRPRERGPFEQGETRRHDMVFGRLKRALDLEMRLSAMNDGRSLIEHTLDALPSGVFVVSKNLDVLHANEAAIGMIGKGRGLEFAHGKLQATQLLEHAAIEAIVANAVGHAEGGPEAVVIGSASGRPIRARAYRVPRRSFVTGGDRDYQVALVVTVDP